MCIVLYPESLPMLFLHGIVYIPLGKCFLYPSWRLYFCLQMIASQTLLLLGVACLYTLHKHVMMLRCMVHPTEASGLSCPGLHSKDRSEHHDTCKRQPA
jgi:hypothetical protein